MLSNTPPPHDWVHLEGKELGKHEEEKGTGILPTSLLGHRALFPSSTVKRTISLRSLRACMVTRLTDAQRFQLHDWGLLRAGLGAEKEKKIKQSGEFPYTLYCRGHLADSLPRKRGFLLELILATSVAQFQDLAALGSNPENTRKGRPQDIHYLTCMSSDFDFFPHSACLPLEYSESYFIYSTRVFSCNQWERLSGMYLPARIKACKIIFRDCVIFHRAHVS